MLDIKSRLCHSDETGSAIVLAVMAAVIVLILGASFSLLVKNEITSAGRGNAYERALYVAEAGVEDVLYQRSKNQSDNCAPYDDDGTLSGAPGQVGGPPASCDDDPDTDADTSDADNDYLPCWPYNEKLYANKITFGPNYYCHDGSDSLKCPSYAPLAVWPADGSGAPAWKDMDHTKPAPLPNAAASSGQRYTTGLFTVCNDDFVGDDTSVEPAKSKMACLAPPCNRSVIFLSIVSTGEVQTRPGETVRRTVKVDILPVGLYAGVIDQFVDLTGVIQADINGPLHINGWWDQANGQSTAFILFSSMSFMPLLTIFDPPEVVSVSYPEDPANPDWQPPLGLSKITYVHLPIRLDIPQPKWDQFEDRMKQLYDDALGLYAAGQVHKVKREDFDSSNLYNPNGDGTTDYEYYHTNGLGQPDQESLCDAGKDGPDFTDCRDSHGIMQMYCPGPWADPQCCAPNAPVSDRIHNCNRNTPAVWNNVAFDLMDINTGGPVTGTEPADLGGGVGTRDRSLRYVTATIYDLHLSGGGCSLTNPFSCLSRTVNKPEFRFMGKHEYQGKVFIDGTLGIGSRTPFHTCGEGDGTLTAFCVIVPPINLGGIGTIPSWRFGVPHWHLGNAKIKGEMLVNGKLFMADYIKIDGGALYADDHVIKDETSALDVKLNISNLLKGILKIIFPPLAAFPASLMLDLVMGALDLVFQLVFPWWPTIDLTNNAFIDFEVYLDVDGWNYANVVNSGVIYTRGDFRYENPDPDLGMSILNVILSLLGADDFGIEFVPALDPVRIWNYGAIIAGGKEINGAPGMYTDGNIYLANDARLDVLVGDPANPDNTIPENTAYMFARNALQISSDLITHYGGGGLFDNCNEFALVDADCAAQGIFYSGGLTADKNPHNQLSMFTTRGGGTMYEDAGNDIYEKKYHPSCIPFEDPDFFGDAIQNTECWTKNFPIMCGVTGFLLGGTCSPSEIDIKGYLFAGKVGGAPNTYFRLDQESSVLMKAVERRYYENLAATPLDWMELSVPTNLPRLN